MVAMVTHRFLLKSGIAEDIVSSDVGDCIVASHVCVTLQYHTSCSKRSSGKHNSSDLLFHVAICTGVKICTQMRLYAIRDVSIWWTQHIALHTARYACASCKPAQCLQHSEHDAR